MEIKYFELAYEDIEQISRMESKFFSTPWSEASIGHYADAGNTIFIVARSSEPATAPSAGDVPPETGNRIPRGESLDSLPRRVVGYAAVSPASEGSAAPPRRVVGYAAVLCAADEGNLVSIGVEEDFREMGIATELLDILYEQALERGVTSINLEVRESNEAAISLYEKEGFERVGKRPDFYRNPSEDAVLYIKKL